MKIRDLAFLIKGTIEGDGNTEVSVLSGADSAKPGDLTFAINEEFLAVAEKSAASAILTTMTIRKSTKPLVRVDNPKMAFLMIYNQLNKPPAPKTYRDPSATVPASAKIGRNVEIAAGARIGENTVIGDDTFIDANVVIGKGCSVGSGCHIYPNVTIYDNMVIKNKVILHSGVVIGSDGFGYVRENDRIYKFPQLGKVVIEDHVEIGANTAIDRGALGDTVIGLGTKIDNLCQIAHNVKIGKHVILAGQCGISGSVTIGDYVSMGGKAGIVDNVKIGTKAMIGAHTGVLNDVEPGAIFWGAIPGQPIMKMKRQLVALHWLGANVGRIKKFLGEKDK